MVSGLPKTSGYFGLKPLVLRMGLSARTMIAVGLGFIVADGEQDRAVAERTHVGGDTAHAADHPLFGRQGFHLGHAGIKIDAA